MSRIPQPPVVVELLREEKPLAQVAAQSELHPSQLRKWKRMVLEHLPELFAADGQWQALAQAQHEQHYE